jgi:ABC-type antimicrobial peptide transport system permease subunit
VPDGTKIEQDYTTFDCAVLRKFSLLGILLYICVIFLSEYNKNDMIKHYLKVAFRNLRKYKSQTLISVAGLAIGFVVFAMASLWLRYEMSYDGFHKNADRLYCVSTPNIAMPNQISRQVPDFLGEHLRTTFPEISNATTVKIERNAFYIDEVRHSCDVLSIDSSFLRMFDIKIIEGSIEFLIPDSKKIAITREKARQLFGDRSPVGQYLKSGNYSVRYTKTGYVRTDEEYTVCAVVTGFSKRSNYPFDYLRYNDNLGVPDDKHAIIELVPDIDVEAFKKKLRDKAVQHWNVTLTPLTAVYYKDSNKERDVQFQHIVIFSIAGSLLILCTLFNYLTLFISRFRIRQRELALRIVCGASNRSLFALLSTEFILSLVISLLLGLCLIQLILPVFMELSNIKMELSSIYLELLIYIAGIILISLLTFLLVLAIFRYRTLNVTIRRDSKKIFRKTSIVVQLIISIVFAFCTTVILKQMYHLHNTDLGFAFKNRGAVIYIDEDREVIANKIRQIPEITEVLDGYYPLLPGMAQVIYIVPEWEDKPKDADPVSILRTFVSEQYLAYYEFQLVEGELLNDRDDPKYVLLNESAVKILGWNKAVGKSFHNFTVKGVIKNIYNISPTLSVRPYCYCLPTVDEDFKGYNSILFKYNKGTWKTCKEKIEAIIKERYPEKNAYSPTATNTEEEYDRFLKSENTLLKLLTLVSLVCMIVCIFGFVSVVSLTCEERRKEIAIRKINGATIKDIFDIFLKEHLTMLVIGALIAFPVGYVVMKRWLEQYVIQTEMSAWIYLSILLVLIMAIVMCTGKRVYKTSRENPIKAITS